jgi:hypothetical protein
MRYIILFLLINNLKTEYSYFIYYSIIILFSIKNNILKYNFNKLLFGREILLLLGMWLYGVIIGVLNGNNINYIVRNFAGITLYGIYFLLVNKYKNIDKIINIVYISGIISIVYIIIGFILYKKYGTNIYYIQKYKWLLGEISGNDGDYSKISFRIISTSALFPLFSVSLYNLIYKKFSIKGICITVISLLGIYWNNSSGFYLATITIFMFLFINISNKKMKYILILFIFILSGNEIKQLFVNIFSNTDTGNMIRINQIVNIIKELNILGNGLGATFNEINLHKELPYSIEVIYLNVIHKFGILSVLYFYTIYKTYLKIYRNIKMKIFIKENYLCIGMMSYIFIGLGNPVIFSPQNVIFHSITMYVLSIINISNKKSNKIL